MHNCAEGGKKSRLIISKLMLKFTEANQTFLSTAVLMAVPKSSDISKSGMQYSSCTNISWNHLEVLTFHRPVIKDDQRQLTNLIWGNPHLHPPLSTLSFGCNEPGFGTLPWIEQPPTPTPSLAQQGECVPCGDWAVAGITSQASPRSPSAQLAASPHATVLLFSWKICWDTTTGICTALKLSDILHHVLFQHRRNRSLPLAGHYSMVLFKQF